MARYAFTLMTTAYIPMYATIEVDADSLDAAQEMAIEQVGEEDWQIEHDDINSATSNGEIDVVGITIETGEG